MLEYDVLFSKPHLWPIEWLRDELCRFRGKQRFMTKAQRLELQRVQREVLKKEKEQQQQHLKIAA